MVFYPLSVSLSHTHTHAHTHTQAHTHTFERTKGDTETVGMAGGKWRNGLALGFLRKGKSSSTRAPVVNTGDRKGVSPRRAIVTMRWLSQHMTLSRLRGAARERDGGEEVCSLRRTLALSFWKRKRSPVAEMVCPSVSQCSWERRGGGTSQQG